MTEKSNIAPKPGGKLSFRRVALGVAITYVACVLGAVVYYSASDAEFPDRLAFGLGSDPATQRVIDEGGTNTIPPVFDNSNGTDQTGQTGQTGQGTESDSTNEDHQKVTKTTVDPASQTTTEAPSTTAAPTTTTVPKTTTTPPTTATPKVVDHFVEIATPLNGSEHDNKHITISGNASEGTRVFAGPYEADMDSAGNWTINLVLSPGENAATLKAYDDSDAVVATATVNMTLVPPSVAFSANQKYGSCSEIEPYDKFFGTTDPGTQVTISSPFGSATTTANEAGEWYKKLYFVDPPESEKFVVTIQAVNGSKEFEFVHTPPIIEYPETVAFSAEQQLGVNTDGWAYDYFGGTTNPGTAVTIVSDYGSVTTTADIWGNFHKKLIFEGLPAGKTIDVVVIADNGTAAFTFTWQPEADA